MSPDIKYNGISYMEKAGWLVCFSKYRLKLTSVLTGRAGSVSWDLRLRPRWEDGGGMTDSSSVVLLPSTAEVCSTLASSMMVWSGGEMNKLHSVQARAKRRLFFRGSSSNTFFPICPIFINVHKQPFLTHDVSLLVPCCFLSWHLRVLQILQELIQTVSLSTLPPLSQLVRYQRSQTPCEHLERAKEADRDNMQADTAVGF